MTSRDADSALRTDALGKRFRQTWALRDCTVFLPVGRVAALVGPNGAGKTTLLRLLVGLLAPTRGTVEVLGQSPTTNTSQALSRVGFLAQEHPLYRRFTVADLLRFGQACNLRFDRELAQRRLAALGIPLDRKAGALSGGQQAQVSLALAVAKRPDLLVLFAFAAGAAAGALLRRSTPAAQPCLTTCPICRLGVTVGVADTRYPAVRASRQATLGPEGGAWTPPPCSGSRPCTSSNASP